MKTTTLQVFVKANGIKYDGPAGPMRDRPVVTSVRVEEGPGHDQVHIWNRGGKAGELTVEKGDGMAIARRLFDKAERITEERVEEQDG